MCSKDLSRKPYTPVPSEQDNVHTSAPCLLPILSLVLDTTTTRRHRRPVVGNTWADRVGLDPRRFFWIPERDEWMISARPVCKGVRRSVCDPEPSREWVGDWGGPETAWALLCVAERRQERRATRPNGEWGYSIRRHMLEPVRPEAVLRDTAFCLPTLVTS